MNSAFPRILTLLRKERGISRFTLEVRVSNTSALHLYESLGFVSAGIRKNFYDLPKEDAATYIKQLQAFFNAGWDRILGLSG